MPISYISPRLQATDEYGRPLVGGRLYTYKVGTTTPHPTYQDADGTAANTNPVILDARGEAVLFLDADQVYTFALHDSNDALIWTQDDITGNASAVDVETALKLASTDHAGPDEPAPMWAHMTWLDTSVTPPRLRRRNAANTAWLDEGVAGVPSLPIFPANAIPTTNIGPIYIADLGEAWWSSSRSKYIALRAVAKYGVVAGDQVIADGVLTLLPLTLGFDDSMDVGITSPNYAATPGLPGLYRCTLVIRAADSPRTTRVFPSVYKNGSAVDYGTDTNLAITSAGQASGAISITSVHMNGSTDYLQMYAYAQVASGESSNPEIGGLKSSMLLEFIK